jgi:hypothetical protein
MGGGKKGYGVSNATASLNDYLYGKGIARNSTNAVGGGSGFGGILNSIVNLPTDIGNLNLGNLLSGTENAVNTGADIIRNPTGEVVGNLAGGLLGGTVGAGYTSDQINQRRLNDELALSNAGYNFNGGKTANNYGQMDNWAAQTQAEQQSVGQVNAQAQDKINEIGYNNLLKLMQNKGEDY